MASQPVVHRQLKNLLIDFRFQFKLLSYFVGLFLTTTVCLYSTTFLFFWKLKTKALNVGIPEGHIFFKFLENQKHDLDMLFIGLAVVNFFLLIAVGFIISHRLAGPVHKLKNYLKNMDSTSEDFKLRQKDFFREIEPVVNEVKNKIK